MRSVVDIKRADPPRPDHPTRYLLVCSGEDGVGKSSICINLAIVLARNGNRVCILDTDPGVTNIHHLLGINSNYTLANVAAGDCTLRDAVRQGPGEISLTRDGGYRRVFEQQDGARQEQFLQQLATWEKGFDYILIDTPSPDHDALHHHIDVADELLLVLAPRPSALSETFSLIREHNHGPGTKPAHIVVNLVNGAAQAELAFEKFRAAVEKYLHSNVLYCGYIPADDTIRNGFALQNPVALYQQTDPSCAHFFKLAQTLETQLMPVASGRSSLAGKLARRVTHGDTSVTQDHATAAPAERQEHPGPDEEKARFMCLPGTADELIGGGLLDARELRSVVDRLVDIGAQAFGKEFSPQDSATTMPKTGDQQEEQSQRSLLGALQQNRGSGKSLDQLLNDFLGEQ